MTLTVLSVMGIATSSAMAKPQPAAWGQYRKLYQQPVEQQTPNVNDRSTWVVSPTDAPWDADDYIGWWLIGNLDAGASRMLELDFWADWKAHLAVLYSDGPGLLLQLSVGGQEVAGSTSAAIVGPDYDHESSLLLPVDGSNGGIAVSTHVTFTVTNVTGKRLRNVFVSADFGDPSDPLLLSKAGGNYIADGWPREGGDPAWWRHSR